MTAEAGMKAAYEGELFGSRAEAKWAAFFKAAGLHFERSAVNLDGDLWWPGFWLPEVESWLVTADKGLTRHELERSRQLAEASQRTVLLADGPPQPRDHILPVWPDGSVGLFGGETRDLARATRCYFADDRRNEGEFWLKSDTGGARSIGPVNGPDHQRDPGLYGAAAKAYDAARAAPLYDLDGKLLKAVISFKEFERKLLIALAEHDEETGGDSIDLKELAHRHAIDYKTGWIRKAANFYEDRGLAKVSFTLGGGADGGCDAQLTGEGLTQVEEWLPTETAGSVIHSTLESSHAIVPLQDRTVKLHREAAECDKVMQALEKLTGQVRGNNSYASADHEDHEQRIA